MTQRYHANAVTNVHIRVKLQNIFFQKTQKEYLLLGKKLTKSEKKVRVYKNITAITFSIIVVLVGLVIIK